MLYRFALTTVLSCALILISKAQQIQDTEAFKKGAETLYENNQLNEAQDRYNKLGYFFWQNGNSDKAIKSFERSIEINKELGNKNAINGIQTNLALIYNENQQYDKGLNYLEETLEFARSSGNKINEVSSLINISTAQRLKGDIQSSIESALQAESLSREIQNRELLKQSYGLLAENYESVGDSENAIKYFNLYTTFEREEQKQLEQKTKQEIASVREEAKIIQEQAKEKIEEVQQETRKKEIQIDSLQRIEELLEQTLKERESRLNSEERLLHISVLALLLATAFGIYLWFNFKKNKRISKALGKKNEKIEAAHEEIQKVNEQIFSSINYASRIQNSILPRKEEIEKTLPESFILYKPRDIVSGDFYWYNYIEPTSNSFKKTDPKTVIAAVDCTGHGIPGAFMSMVGSSLLNRIVSVKGITSPENILNELHSGIKYELQQDKNESKDGMDLALCTINHNSKTIEFAGAKNPLVYITNNEMHQIKGDKFGIGGTDLKRNSNRPKYTKHIIKYESPICLYLFSDGFQDQFGGPEERKYMIKRLKKLLLEIHPKPVEEQYKILNTEFEEWKGNSQKQIDDVLLIGIKL
ncbi:MAG: tetratricopeptide repeat protein [Bacteroidota bacterium]